MNRRTTQPKIKDFQNNENIALVCAIFFGWRKHLDTDIEYKCAKIDPSKQCQVQIEKIACKKKVFRFVMA